MYRLWSLKSERNPQKKGWWRTLWAIIFMSSTREFLSYSLVCNWLINIIQSNSLCSLANAFWWVQRHGKQQMSEWKSKCEQVSEWVCLYAVACIRRPITFPTCSSNETQWNIALSWFVFCKNERKPCFCMHAITCIYKHKHIHKHVHLSTCLQ